MCSLEDKVPKFPGLLEPCLPMLYVAPSLDLLCDHPLYITDESILTILDIVFFSQILVQKFQSDKNIRVAILSIKAAGVVS